MPDLPALQARLAAALQGTGADAALGSAFHGDADSLRRRVDLYRANILAARTRALGSAYPVVKQVVGDAFFEALARAHARVAPSASGDLHDYGAAFATFIDGFEPAGSLPWLGDVARLEWAVHRAATAADPQAFDATRLAGVDAGRQGALRLRWSAGTALVVSAHPVARLWQVHQPGFDGAFEVDWSIAERALVWRDGFEVRVDAVTPGEAAFFAATLAGEVLERAVGAAWEAEPGFELARVLGTAIRRGLLAGIDP